MKKMNFLEIIGFVLIVLGFLFMFLNDRIENTSFSFILAKHNLFHWAGLGIWATGYIIKGLKKKNEKENDEIKYDL